MKKKILFQEVDAYVERVEDSDLLQEQPVVTVAIITYNQEDSISQCVESVLNQKCDFNFEIIIKEDRSTDATREIILDFYHKNPGVFRLWLCQENLWKTIDIGEHVRNACRGKYIAFLEGDDYWTDPLKLQKQVDFLEAHPECSGCFHAARIEYDDGVEGCDVYRPEEIRDRYGLSDFLRRNLAPTASVVVRAEYIQHVPEWFRAVKVGDWFLTGLALQHGDFGYFDEVMSVYRRHGSGMHGSMKRVEQMMLFAKAQKDYVRYLAPHLKQDLTELHRHTSRDMIFLMQQALERGDRNEARQCMFSALKLDWRIARKCLREQVGVRIWLPLLMFRAQKSDTL